MRTKGKQKALKEDKVLLKKSTVEWEKKGLALLELETIKVEKTIELEEIAMPKEIPLQVNLEGTLQKQVQEEKDQDKIISEKDDAMTKKSGTEYDSVPFD